MLLASTLHQPCCTSCTVICLPARETRQNTTRSSVHAEEWCVVISEDNPGSSCWINSVTSALFWYFVASLVFQFFSQITVSDSGSSSDSSFHILGHKLPGLLLYIAAMVIIWHPLLPLMRQKVFLPSCEISLSHFFLNTEHKYSTNISYFCVSQLASLPSLMLELQGLTKRKDITEFDEWYFCQRQWE